jgi:hypothetical protein
MFGNNFITHKLYERTKWVRCLSADEIHHFFFQTDPLCVSSCIALVKNSALDLEQCSTHRIIAFVYIKVTFVYQIIIFVSFVFQTNLPPSKENKLFLSQHKTILWILFSVVLKLFEVDFIRCLNELDACTMQNYYFVFALVILGLDVYLSRNFISYPLISTKFCGSVAPDQRLPLPYLV